MENSRKDPNQILKEIQKEENQHKEGTLKIFFGYAAGVGKTYAMLSAAHEMKQKGVDVVIGYVEPHARPATQALVDGLEQVPVQYLQYNGVSLREFDIDAALKRKPALILVDELAHTNVEGSRHEKRYQDVEELLKAGIDVYTTVNVQHIESLNDIVSSITGIYVRERIPDSIFNRANEVEIVDIEPKDLINRLNDGKIYKKSQAKKAIEHFFTLKNLTALREISLRKCADQVNFANEDLKYKSKDEHILVCLSSSPSNPKIIRTAARMVHAFKAKFTAIFVETPEYADMSEENLKRLNQNIRLAEQLGAKIETVVGNDIALQISEFARYSNVSKIVVGRSAIVKGNYIFKKNTLVEKLIILAPEIDVYIIPDAMNNQPYWLKKAKAEVSHTAHDIFWSFFILFISSGIGIVFAEYGVKEANIIMVYVFGVLLISILTHHRIYSLASSIGSVLIFNFLFTEPYFSLKAYNPGYPITFFIMFMSALLTSSLAIRLKSNAKKSALFAVRTKILLDTSQSLQQVKTKEEIMEVTAKQLIQLMQKDIVFYENDNGCLKNPKIYYSYANGSQKKYDFENERAVAMWVLKNNKHAGATTQTLNTVRCLYLSIRINDEVYGVVGIAMEDACLDSYQKSIMLSILGECALALENEKNVREKEEAAVLAKNEQLRSSLLRSISHDLRTPLTSISGNASNLIDHDESLDEATKQQLYMDIYDDSMWLINLVENLLSVTRLEENRLNLKLSSELIYDVVEEALQHVNRRKSEYILRTVYEDELLLAKMEVRLIMQVIINIVDNAMKYTPSGSEIVIRVCRENHFAKISIADNGSGMSDEMKEKIFDMFYVGSKKVADSHRSLGLGLSLCKTIVKAHGGEIYVRDNCPHGSVFTFTLPIEEVKMYE